MANAQAFFKVKLPVQLKKREKWYLASCKVLDVYSQGTCQKKPSITYLKPLPFF